MSIELKNVASVYSGVNGRCCCGCAGKHTYASAYQELASKGRWFEVKDDEVNDRTVALIVNKINKLTIDPADDHGQLVSAVSGNRRYIAYLKTHYEP